MSISRRRILGVGLLPALVPLEAAARIAFWPLTASPPPPKTRSIILAVDQPIRHLTLPGKPFAKSVRLTLAELKSAFNSQSKYPISRLFELLPFRLIEDGVAARLIGRGDLHFSDGSVSNKGDYVEAEFNDQNIGLLTIAFDEELSAKVSQPDAASLLFDFSASPPVVLLQSASERYLIDTNQRALSVSLATDKVDYQLVSAQDPNRRLTITVDLSLDEPNSHLQAPSIQVASLTWPPPAVAILAGGNDEYHPICKCNCCGTEICGPPCPADPPRHTSSPAFADFRAQCIRRNGNQVMTYYTYNVLNQTSDYDPRSEYVGRTLIIRESDFPNCNGSGLFGPGPPIKSARIKVTQVEIVRVLNNYRTWIYGDFVSDS